MGEKLTAVRWSEMHANSRSLIYSELINDVWELHERETWDVRWHAIQPTKMQLETADRLLREASGPRKTDSPAAASWQHHLSQTEYELEASPVWRRIRDRSGIRIESEDAA